MIKRKLYVKRTRPVRRVRRSRGSKLSKVPKSVKAYVKRQINTKAELKHAAPLVRNNLPISAYGIVNPHQLTCEDLNTVFTIPQGTADGQRIGDKIRVKSLSLKGYVNLDSSRANNEGYLKNPMYVKMFVGRRVNTTSNPNTYGTTGFADFLQAGPTAQAPQNLPSDMYRYVNKEVYKIFATRIFKIGMSAPSNNPADSNQWNNDFKFSKNFSISLNKHIDVVKYSDGGIEQQNVAFYCWFLVCWANGAQMDALQQPPLEWHYDLNCTYYDE